MGRFLFGNGLRQERLWLFQKTAKEKHLLKRTFTFTFTLLMSYCQPILVMKTPCLELYLFSLPLKLAQDCYFQKPILPFSWFQAKEKGSYPTAI